jgi:two-component system sensor histidine kinase MtrB
VGVLGVASYAFAEHYLVRQREDSLLRQAFVDARVLRDEIEREQEISGALQALDLGPRSAVAVSIGGQWYGTSVASSESSLPSKLRETVESGAAAHMRVTRDGTPQLVVGFPIPSVDAQYYETFALTELHSTLNTLRNALAIGGSLAIAFGAGLGLWMSRRVLRPVSSFASAAERVAKGDLAVRLTAGDDPDLASLATSFNEMVDAVQRRIDRESRFVADVSHELRSPITTLSTASQLVSARADELPARLRRAVELMVCEVERLQQLVEDLLELGRADAGVSELQRERVGLRELVARTLEANHTSDVPVIVDSNGTGDPAETRNGDVFADLDKRRLDRVLTNLVTNAKSHGNGLSRVRITKGNGFVRIAVDDRGPGVSPAERDDVFERFFRGAVGGRRGSGSGTGLGLALVAEHVRLHGGRVWVEDNDDGGARFVVELPGEDR